MRENLNSGPETAPARKWVVILVLLLAVAGALVAYILHRPSEPTVVSSEPEQQTPAVTVEKADSSPTPAPAPNVAVSRTSSAVAHVVPPPAVVPQTDVSPQARQIVTALAQLNMTNGPM